MKRVFILIFLFSSFSSKSQIILGDSIGDVNCYHEGFIYTQINSLGSNVLSKWYFLEGLSWNQIDTSHQSIFINKNIFDSDTLTTKVCGSFKLEIIDNNGNFIEDKLFEIQCKLSISIQKEIIICNNDVGSFYSNVFGGVLFDSNITIVGDEYYQYQWFTAQSTTGANSSMLPDTTSFIDSLLSSYYQLVVTDAIGCTDSTQYMYLLQPDVLAINYLDIFDVNCNGTSTASIYLSVSGGRKVDSLIPYSYYLLSGLDTISFSDSNGSTLNFQNNSINMSVLSTYPDSVLISGLSSDTFRLIILDSVSCMLDTVFYISEPEEYNLYASNDQLICSSDSVWIRIDSISGGLQPFNYSWESSQVDSIFGSPGDYFCVINDTVNSCNDTIKLSLSSLYELKVILDLIDAKCFSDSSGSILVDSIFGGVPPYNINWGTNYMSLLPASLHYLIITDSIGCKYFDTITISQPALLQSLPFISHPICTADSNGFVIQNYFGGTPPYQVIGFNQNFNDTITSLSTGNYPYLLLDSNLCDLYDTLIIIDPLPISLQFINYNQHLVCYNGTTSIEAEVNDYDSSFTLLWSNGSDSNITSLSAGISVVYVIDNNGCDLTDSILITQPDTFKIEEFILVDTICNAGGSAFITLQGGAAPYSYLWSTGDTNSTIANILDSICWVNVSDSCGNLLVSDTLFFTPFQLEATSEFNDTTHVGYAVIDITSSGGGFDFEWTNILGDTISLNFSTSKLCEGTYFVVTTDVSNNCMVIDTLNVAYNLPFGIVDSLSTTIWSDTLLWGFGPYSYLWSNGDITQHSNLCFGFHWVEIKDSYNCKIREDVIIEPLLISLQPSSTLVECELVNLDIDIEASVIGGVKPYSFEWWNGSTENPINLDMSPGNYSVQVADENGCVEDTSFAIAAMTAECIPNIFTPNGDNINDTWSLEDTFLFEDSEVLIYGRFGKLLFQSVGYHTAWDGTNETGNDVPAGVYFYSIEIGHEFEPIKGTVTILR